MSITDDDKTIQTETQSRPVQLRLSILLLASRFGWTEAQIDTALAQLHTGGR